MAENVWREEHCDNMEPLYCPDCNIPDPCPAAWHCEDIMMITNGILESLDTNYD
jgi:alpha-D-ribose 1-methylphosphonate 5-triphosphate diphosphatase PhnM